MIPNRIFLIGLAVLPGFLIPALGQIIPVTIGPSVSKFLGQTNAFSAQADLSQGGGRLAIRFFYNQGNTRAEMDLSRLAWTDAVRS